MPIKFRKSEPYVNLIHHPLVITHHFVIEDCLNGQQLACPSSQTHKKIICLVRKDCFKLESLDLNYRRVVIVNLAWAF